MKVVGMSMFVITESLAQDSHANGGAGALPSAHVSADASRYVLAKDVIDFAFAFSLLILTAPLLLAAVLLVKLTSPGPAIYSQTRLGRKGRPFTIYKVRTMGHNCESLTGAQWSRLGDVRVTPLGRWLRRTHIDELPQLWNVLCGDMSLIGPRPERPEFVPQLEQAIPHYRQRLDVRPGVTGLAQVQFPPDTDLNSVRTKLAYDLYYVRHVHFLFDLRIYWATFFKMCGVSFPVIQWAFGFPPRPHVESQYQALVALPNVPGPDASRPGRLTVGTVNENS
jgi:lipopolysaccharide/colanic/teichoic acid biosynthesis glycosyltransferase